MHYWIISYVCCPHFIFPSESLIFVPNPGHYTPKSLCYSPNGLIFTPNLFFGYIPVCAILSGYRAGGLCCACKACCANLLWGVDLNGWGCTGVHGMILARYIYCSNYNHKTNPQSRSWVCKVLGTQSMQITLEYDLVTAISIRPLTQPLMCEMGSSIFAATSWLKVASTTWTSLTIIPSTKRTNGYFFLLVVEVFPVLVLIKNFPPRKKLIHSLCLPSLRVSISEPDINNCICLDLP